jgi:hypothetical protein
MQKASRTNFSGMSISTMMGNNESICEGFMEGNKRKKAQYFIILTQTSVFSPERGEVQGVV